MDRDRLKDVQQTELTESRVNEDFVDWLKNKGPTYLLGIMVVLCAVIGWDRYQDWRVAKQDEAWFALENATGSLDLQRVAEQYDLVKQVALLRAADLEIASIHMNRRADAAAAISEEETAPFDRDEALERAETLYQDLLELTTDDPTKRLYAINASFGLAVVAEMRDERDEAASYYDRATELAGNEFPSLADRARQRKSSLDELPEDFDLVHRDELQPVDLVNDMFSDLIDLNAPADENDADGEESPENTAAAPPDEVDE